MSLPNMKSTTEIIKETREKAIQECIDLCKLRKNGFCYNQADAMLDKVIAKMQEMVDCKMKEPTVPISRDLLIRLLQAHDAARSPNYADMEVIRIAVTPVNIVPRKETVVLSKAAISIPAYNHV